MSPVLTLRASFSGDSHGPVLAPGCLIPLRAVLMPRDDLGGCRRLQVAGVEELLA